MRDIEIEDGVNGYVDLVKHVVRNGRGVAPRGLETFEIEDAVIRIANPYAALPLGVGRGIVPGIGAVEACQLLAGISVPKTVIAIGPQFARYAEDNGKFYGSYGDRTNGQYDMVISKLKQDPDSRQAVVTMWNASLDNEPGKRDYPCTVMHQFRIRNNKLNMSVYMRSNDVWLGAAYDFFQFTRVQIAMASVLEVGVGEYNHHVGSLHIYKSDLGSIDTLHRAEFVESTPAITGPTWDSIKTSAAYALSAAVADVVPNDLSDAERWNALAMRAAIEKNSRKSE